MAVLQHQLAPICAPHLINAADPMVASNGGICVRAPSSCWLSVTACVCVCWIGAGSSGIARERRVYEKYMEGPSGVDGGWIGFAYAGCVLEHPGWREDPVGFQNGTLG